MLQIPRLPYRPRLGPALVLAAVAALATLPYVAAAGEDGLAHGSRGAVATEHSLASAAGLTILKAGGNAVDAAVAAALAIGVVNPSSAGLGGGGFLVVFNAATGKASSLDFRERAPAGAYRDMYKGPGPAGASRSGGLAVAVPGEALGLERALELYGSVSLAEAAAPALALARQGFIIQDHLARAIGANTARLAANGELASIFLSPQKQPLKAGQRLLRPHLASTLALLSTEGSKPFYDGIIAQQTVASVAAAGGILVAADLASYRVVEREAVRFGYRGFEFFSMGPPSSGGGTIAQALALLEGHHLGQLGHSSTTYRHLLAETMKAVFADRARLYGDPDFTQVPMKFLLSPERAKRLRSGLSAASAAPANRYQGALVADDRGTSHISVVDRRGNAASLTSSINTSFGAAVGIDGHGIVLNNTMDDFSLAPGLANVYGLVGSQANAIAANKRPLSSMSPAILTRDGRVRLVVGASGGPLIISSTLQVLLAVVDFSLPVGEAVAAPRIHHQWQPDSLGLEPAAGELAGLSLGRLGHEVFPLGRAAAVAAIEVTDSGLMLAVSDPRKGGRPAAY